MAAPSGCWKVRLRRARPVVGEPVGLAGFRRRTRPFACRVVLAGSLLLAPHLAAATPLTKPEVIKLVRKNVQERRLLAVVRELGIDFKLTAEVVDELRAAGATLELVAALQAVAAGELPAASPPAPPAALPSAAVPPPAAAPPPPPTAPAAATPAPDVDRPEPAEADRPPAPLPPSPGGAPASRVNPEAVAALIPAPPPLPPPPALRGPVVTFAEPETRPVAAAPPPARPAPAPEPAAEPPGKWELVRPLLEKAQALSQEGDVRGAQTLLARALEIDPGEPKVWKAFKFIEQDLLVRAETFLADGQLPRALREFQFVITTNPESALGHNGVGLVLLQLKNYDEAVSAFERALALEPANTRYRQALNRARSLQKASRALERTGQENLKEMIGDQPGKKKGP